MYNEKMVSKNNIVNYLIESPGETTILSGAFSSGDFH